MALSRTQVDRLGERLKAGPIGDADQRLLDEYRLTYTEAALFVANRLSDLGLFRTIRIKTKSSIVEKLRRESIRLTQIQDIAGCRVWVFDMNEQDAVAQRIEEVLPGCRRVDRRSAPSHSYRALHLVATHGGQPVEIQVRTELQHRWARLSEKLAEPLGQGLKYGQGPIEMLSLLDEWSVAIRRWEEWVAAGREVRSTTLEEQTEIERAHQLALHGGERVLVLLRRLLSHTDTDPNEP